MNAQVDLMLGDCVYSEKKETEERPWQEVFHMRCLPQGAIRSGLIALVS